MTNVEKEVLLITQEECAEVVQAISKCFRFGMNDSYNGKTNRESLVLELGDLQCNKFSVPTINFHSVICF